MSIRSRNTFFIACVGLCVGFAGIPGCERKPPEVRRQAILFLLDAARPDRFSCYGYQRATTPEMDRLAARGVVFREHFAQGTATRVSLSSLMFSRFYSLPLFPNSRQVPYSNPADLFRGPDDAQISFVKALESAGLRTAAVSAHIWTGENTAFASEFGEMHDLATRFDGGDRPYPSAETVIDYAINWIRENKDRDYFLYVHLMDTHFPHYFEADAQEFFGASSYGGKAFGPGGRMLIPDSSLSDEDRRYANALYDGSLRYMDRHMGRLVEFLRRQELIANTLIVITADHGEHLFDQPGGRTRDGLPVFRHAGPWFDPVARIPLIIHYPAKLKAGEFTHLSEGVDVGPTLLGLLNVSLPTGKAFDGIDLGQVINGQVPPKDHVSIRRSIRTDRYKCLFTTPDNELLGDSEPDRHALSGQLYDLVADPRETTNVFQSKPKVVGELLKRYRTSMASLFQRYEAARSSHQPRSEFAISARFMVSDVALPVTSEGPLPDGWSRRKRRGETGLLASNTSDPLMVHFPLPNGRYLLSLKMVGHAIIDVGEQRRDLSHRGMVEFGEINVTDEVFRATIRPQGNQLVGLTYFGFTPPGVAGQDQDAIDKQLERLRALGYVE